MSYSLDQFAADCRSALDADPGTGGREQLRKFTEKACSDPDFVAKYLGPDNTSQRSLLYEDDKHKFCIFAHVYVGARNSNPHDHGPSWAIYGQADGVTTMTDWEKLTEPNGDAPGTVRKRKVYELTPGIAYLYNEGDLHSPSREATTRLVRIEGVQLAGLHRDKYVEAD